MVATATVPGLALATGAGPLAGPDRRRCRRDRSIDHDHVARPGTDQRRRGPGRGHRGPDRPAAGRTRPGRPRPTTGPSSTSTPPRRRSPRPTPQLTAERAKLTAAKAVLRKDVIQSYIGGTSSSAVAKLFAAPSGERPDPEPVRAPRPRRPRPRRWRRVQSGQNALSCHAGQAAGRGAEPADPDRGADQAAQQAPAAAALSQATLAQVKGTLAQEIAQQAAPQAAAAAAAAASATTPTDRQAAAAQASQAAQVASTVSGGSAAATSANQSANQAAGSATGPIPERAATLRPPASPRCTRRCSTSACPTSGAARAPPVSTARGSPCWPGPGRRVAPPLGGLPVLRVPPRQPRAPSNPATCSSTTSTGRASTTWSCTSGPTLDGQPTAYGSGTIIQAAHTGTVVTFDPLWYYGLVGAARPERTSPTRGAGRAAAHPGDRMVAGEPR